MKTRTFLFGNVGSKDLLWILFLLFPALYINLDMLPLIGDEAIRALVSLEMMISGDYITPTINGELYFNKPPLFNWILTFVFKLCNNNTELICRLPTTLFLVAYCLTIFLWIKKQLGTQSGILAALMFLTCGRILFWDSFLGLIDITFSWIIFLNFILIWQCFEKKKFLSLFILSYTLTAIGFMLKGIPSLVFQGITLAVLFLSTHNFKRIFSWKHILGILTFFLIVSVYYYLYYLKHPDNIGTLLLRLIHESTQKSAIGHGMGKTILHVFAFPIEIIYHFAPWTFLIILIFNKKILTRASSVPFIKYCIIVFLANIIVYWLSPVTYPRYLLMLIPLLFIVLLHLARYHASADTLNYRIVKVFFLSTSIILALINALLPFIFMNKLPVNHLIFKAGFILIIGVLALYVLCISRKGTHLLYTLGIILLASRISFNLFLVPYRESISWGTLCRSDAIQLAEKTQHKELFLMTDTITAPNSYYLTRERNEILKFNSIRKKEAYYIVEDTMAYGNAFKNEFAMRICRREERFYIGRFVSIP